MSSKNARHRSWCYTRNNYTAADEAQHQSIEAEYHTYGREVGEQGTPHLQGFIHFKNAKTLSAVKKLLPGVHLEIKRGTFEQAIKYCHKEDMAPYEKGDVPLDPKDKGETEKARWSRIRDLAKTGDLEGIGEEAPAAFVKGYRTLKQIASDYLPRPADLEDVAGEWLYGESGSGKTTMARNIATKLGLRVYIKDRTKWWNGYDGEEIVVMDDFDPYCRGMAAMVKDWGDKYSFKAETKNGYMWIRPRKFVVTSQYLPRQIWDDEPTIDAIESRFHILELKTKHKKTRKIKRSIFEDEVGISKVNFKKQKVSPVYYHPEDERLQLPREQPGSFGSPLRSGWPLQTGGKAPKVQEEGLRWNEAQTLRQIQKIRICEDHPPSGDQHEHSASTQESGEDSEQED